MESETWIHHILQAIMFVLHHMKVGSSKSEPQLPACRKKLIEALRENNTEIIATLAADQNYVVPSSAPDKLSAVVQGIIKNS